MNLTQEQARKRAREIADQLKLALHHADFLTRSTVDAANMNTLWTIIGKAYTAAAALKSEVGGNEPPKVGG